MTERSCINYCTCFLQKAKVWKHRWTTSTSSNNDYTHKIDSLFSGSGARAVLPNALYANVFKLPYHYALYAHLRAQTSGLCQCWHRDCLLLLHPPRKLAFRLGWDQVNKNNCTVWWSWQRRWEVMKMVLTHYFKQTKRALMREIKEWVEIWQGSVGCGPEEATIFCRKSHSACDY